MTLDTCKERLMSNHGKYAHRLNMNHFSELRTCIFLESFCMVWSVVSFFLHFNVLYLLSPFPSLITTVQMDSISFILHTNE